MACRCTSLATNPNSLATQIQHSTQPNVPTRAPTPTCTSGIHPAVPMGNSFACVDNVLFPSRPSSTLPDVLSEYSRSFYSTFLVSWQKSKSQFITLMASNFLTNVTFVPSVRLSVSARNILFLLIDLTPDLEYPTYSHKTVLQMYILLHLLVPTQKAIDFFFSWWGGWGELLS